MRFAIFASVSAAALMIAGSALADGNTATVSDNGTGDKSYVEQTQASNSTSTVGQSGDSNWAKSVQQSNGGAASSIGQADSSQSAYVWQNGSSDVKVSQSNNGNQASVVQDAAGTAGVGNEAVVNQTGANGKVGGVTDSEKASAQTSLAQPVDQGVVQKGSYNYSSVGQGGFSNSATITQISTDSTHFAPGGGDSDGNGFYNYSTVGQYGSSDIAGVTQDGDNRSNIQQSGSIDHATVSQVGYNNSSSIGQTGANDTAAVNQGDELGGSGHGNNAVVSQDGTSNGEQANVTQTWGNNNNASVGQSGVNDHATVLQWFGDGNTALVTQTASSSGSLATVNQNGDGNYATVYQAGGMNIANIQTVGANNTDSITQTGGGGNNAEILQYVSPTAGGAVSGNSATIAQNSGNFAQVWQTTNNNIANVSQSGTGGVTYVKQ
jgi:hypothetical protein